MSVRIFWLDDVPPEVKTALEPMLERWSGMLPTWLHDLVVDYAPDNSAAMMMNTEFCYRRAGLVVTGKWLRCGSAEREEIVRHELSHIILGPLQSAAEDVIDRLTDGDDTLGDYLRDSIRAAVEGVTCDLAVAIFETSKSWGT